MDFAGACARFFHRDRKNGEFGGYAWWFSRYAEPPFCKNCSMRGNRQRLPQPVWTQFPSSPRIPPRVPDRRIPPVDSAPTRRRPRGKDSICDSLAAIR